MKKLRKNRGESLVETLASMLIIVLGTVILAGAIVTAGRINDTARQKKSLVVVDYSQPALETENAKTVTVTGDGITGSPTMQVKVYTYAAEENQNGARLYCYEKG